jgi:phosphocarrier protein
MKTIKHIIKDELGLHARPAGKIVKHVKNFPGNVEIGTSEKMVDCKRIIGVMSLALKHGDTLSMTFEGDNEDAFAEEMLAFLQEEL